MSNQKLNKKPRLAWYENNKDFTDPIRIYLQKTFEVCVFDTPDEAEKGISDYQPDIIIFDYRMPSLSGIEMYNRLKKKKLQFIPVFFSIWANDDASKQKFRQARIDEDAIFDKHMDCESFANRIFYLYNKMKKK